MAENFNKLQTSTVVAMDYGGLMITAQKITTTVQTKDICGRVIDVFASAKVDVGTIKINGFTTDTMIKIGEMAKRFAGEIMAKKILPLEKINDNFLEIIRLNSDLEAVRAKILRKRQEADAKDVRAAAKKGLETEMQLLYGEAAVTTRNIYSIGQEAHVNLEKYQDEFGIDMTYIDVNSRILKELYKRHSEWLRLDHEISMLIVECRILVSRE